MGVMPQGMAPTPQGWMPLQPMPWYPLLQGAPSVSPFGAVPFQPQV